MEVAGAWGQAGAPCSTPLVQNNTMVGDNSARSVGDEV